MRRAPALSLCVFALAASAGPALAHAGHAAEGPGWFEDPWATAMLAVSGGLYAVGTVRLWGRAGAGRGIARWRAACFAAGWLSLALTLCSPVAGWSERLFVAHMTEHELMMTLAAPLMVIGRPLIGMLWAFPRRGRHAVAAFFGAGPLLWLWNALTEPLTATVLHGAALWAWHAPSLFALALENPFWHAVQHLSFFGTAVMFWWALAKSRAYGAAVFWLFATSLHSGFLGILIALARAPWYPGQGEASVQFGLSPLEDQQLAGLVMWVPAGVVYAGAALVAMGLWIHRSSRTAGGRHVPLAS